MKAIVNVNRQSSYSKYNGLTFEVHNLGTKTITLIIDSEQVDFSLKEVLIVNLESEIKKASLNDKPELGSNLTTYSKLLNYCDIKKINYMPA